MADVTRKTAGRPRRLTLERVLDEAMAMGVDQIEMAPLAKRLGVAVGTLYSYVNSREHLIFQVASRQTQTMEIKDVGQDWPDILREHAARTYDRLRGWPQVLVNLITGNAGPHFGVESRRAVTGLMTSRGLPLKQAHELYFEANQIVLGALVAIQYIDSTLAPLQSGKKGAETLGFPGPFGRYEASLERLIADHQQRLAPSTNPR